MDAGIFCDDYHIRRRAVAVRVQGIFDEYWTRRQSRLYGRAGCGFVQLCAALSGQVHPPHVHPVCHYRVCVFSADPGALFAQAEAEGADRAHVQDHSYNRAHYVSGESMLGFVVRLSFEVQYGLYGCLSARAKLDWITFQV